MSASLLSMSSATGPVTYNMCAFFSCCKAVTHYQSFTMSFRLSTTTDNLFPSYCWDKDIHCTFLSLTFLNIILNVDIYGTTQIHWLYVFPPSQNCFQYNNLLSTNRMFITKYVTLLSQTSILRSVKYR